MPQRWGSGTTDPPGAEREVIVAEREDVRWRQRLDNYLRAMATLERVVGHAGEAPWSEVEQLALIQAFEFCHELAWNLLRDYLVADGATGLTGSRSTTRLAFEVGLLKDGQVWMDMIEARNRTSHTYDEAQAAEIAGQLVGVWLHPLQDLRARFQTLADKPGSPK